MPETPALARARTGLFRPTWLGGGVNLYAYVQNNPVNYIDPLGLCLGGTCHGQDFLDWYNPDPYLSDRLAQEPAPYTHADERDARQVIPNPFGDNCDEMKEAINVLKAQIAWRYTDLNPRSATYSTHLRHIKALEDDLKKLEQAYKNILGLTQNILEWVYKYQP